MESIKNFLELRVKAIKNFNRFFNSITILLNVIMLSVLLYLKSLNIYDASDNRTKFIKMAIKVSFTSLLVSLSVFLAIQKYNATSYNMIAVINNLLFSLFFQVFSGLLRSYLFFTSDPLLFVISLEIIIRYLIVTYKYPSFKIMAYSTVIILSYAWISMILYHNKVPSPIIFYNMIQTIVFGMLMLYSKTYENSKIIEAELMKAGENERNYYINILDNLNVGFFIAQGSKINLYNKNVMNLMVSYYSSKDIQIEDDKFDEDIIIENSMHHLDANPFDFIKFLYEEEDSSGKIEKGKISSEERSNLKIEEFIEILLSNFQSFVPKTNHSLIKLFRSTSSRKLQLIRPIIVNLQEFIEFTKVGRIKLQMDSNNFMYFDISFRVSKRIVNKEYIELVEFILNDVTQVIQVEKDKNDIKFKSVLLAKIAHEFKNPINTINAVCTSLNIKIMQNPKVLAAFKEMQDIQDYKSNNFNFIVSLCDYLLFLIEDLNSFVKFGLGKKTKERDKESVASGGGASPAGSDKSFQNKMSNLNLVQLLDFCYNIFNIRQAYDKGKPFLQIKKKYSKDLPKKFYTNEVKLKQVIINLLSNAYKFTVSGSVTLAAKYIAVPGRKSIQISVTDTGTGLDKEEINKIFKPFEVAESNQVHNCQGSGLGLSIVNDILEHFNSKIVVESELNKGSTFYFELDHIDRLNLGSSNERILENDLEDEELEIIPGFKYDLVKDKEGSSKKPVFNSQDDDFRQQSSEDEEDKRSFANHSTSTIEKNDEPTSTDFHKSFMEEFRKSRRFGTSIGFGSFSSCPSIKFNFKKKNTSTSLSKCESLFDKDLSNGLGETYSVIVCDDEHLIAESIVRILKRISTIKKVNIITNIVKNGIECLYQVYKDSLEGKKIDLLLIDENMPFMIGSECIKILKNLMVDKKLIKFSIYSITGYVDNEHISYIKNCGSDGFYNKPISMNMMLDLLVKCNIVKSK